MAKAADTPAPQGVQRGRGGFYRGSNDVPYVSDPSGELVKSGPRKGEPRRIPYGSPSNRGKQIENATNLVKWGERRVVLGIGADPELLELCGQLVGLDVDSDEYKTLADTIIVRAKDAAKVSLAADRGTHGHALTEDHDEDRDIVARAEAGELLGIDAALQRRIFTGWGALLATHDLEVLAVEASVVDDLWRLAGTLDRIVRLRRDLRFVLPTGEVVTIPAGTVIVLDVKTGKLRLDRSGAPMYWHGYAIQIASYAQSRPYDTETETRGTWDFEIDQRHALIAHLDLAALVAGEEVDWHLVYVDLTAGREHGGECVVMAKAWENRTDVFSVAQLVEEAAASASSTPTSVGSPVPAEAPQTEVPEAAACPPAAPAPRSPRDEQEAVRSRPAPDDGDQVVDPTFDVLKKNYVALPAEGRAWITALTEQAMHGGVSFHSNGHRTVRRFEIIRGLVLLAGCGLAEDEVARAALHEVIGDVAHFASVPPGQLIGSLSAAEAVRFAQVCDRITSAPFALVFTPEGNPTLRSAA